MFFRNEIHRRGAHASEASVSDLDQEGAVEAKKPQASIISTNDSDEPFTTGFYADRPKINTLTHRGLKPRHIQLIGIGGAVGTALFVQISASLNKGGPASLFISFTAWCIPILCLSLTTAEMVTQFPVSSPFITLAGRCFDEAVEVMSGWNFLFLQATLVPFEITSVTYIIHYWRSDFNPVYVLIPQIVLYIAVNSICPVKYYGEIEFWIAILKVLMVGGLLLFTFITMVGGNPIHDAYGFRFWKNPGAFADYLPGDLASIYSPGSLSKFLGFAACFSQASYVVSGPDYVAMCAGEAMNPRKVLPKAFKGAVYRLSIFFSLGTLAMGIVCAYNDPLLLEALNTNDSGASGSPYVIAMERMKIPILPDIFNVCLIISAISAGNSYFFCSSRTLYAMALRKHAPKIFTICLPNGAPIVASSIGVLFAMLSLLQLGSTANEVLSWIMSLATVSELWNYALMSATFLRFYAACKAQGIDRNTLAYKSPWQPYLAWVSLVCCFSMVILAGWSVFIKGNWSITSLVFGYVMIPVNIVIYLGWKLWKRPKLKSASEIDLHSGLAEIEEHERLHTYEPSKNIFDRFIRIIIGED